MIKYFKLTLTLFFSIFLFSCSAPKWSYEKDAVTLHLTGDPKLNLYQEQPHSLIACIYHLKDLNGFNQLMDEKGGLPRLLECSRFDSSVTYAKRLVIQPGQELDESQDRTEGAQYVGLTTGYYSLQKELSVRSFKIPVSMFNNPKKLKINLYMGPDGIQESKDKK